MTRKYRNQPVVIDGVRFDSKKESFRWRDLQMLEKGGWISQLERQVSYVLAPGVKLAGEKRARPAIRYVADFRYFSRETGGFVVEDVKSPATAKESAFRLKLHLMKVVHNIDVVLS